MRIALVTEGTYPTRTGGVSTWCDQMVREMPEHDWTVVALTATGSAHVQKVRSWLPSPHPPPASWRS